MLKNLFFGFFLLYANAFTAGVGSTDLSTDNDSIVVSVVYVEDNPSIQRVTDLVLGVGSVPMFKDAAEFLEYAGITIHQPSVQEYQYRNPHIFDLTHLEDVPFMNTDLAKILVETVPHVLLESIQTLRSTRTCSFIPLDGIVPIFNFCYQFRAQDNAKIVASLLAHAYKTQKNTTLPDIYLGGDANLHSFNILLLDNNLGPGMLGHHIAAIVRLLGFEGNIIAVTSNEDMHTATSKTSSTYRHVMRDYNLGRDKFGAKEPMKKDILKRDIANCHEAVQSEEAHFLRIIELLQYFYTCDTITGSVAPSAERNLSVLRSKSSFKPIAMDYFRAFLRKRGISPQQ